MGTVFHIEDTLSRAAPCCSRPSLSTTRQKMTTQSFHWLSCARRSDASGRTERRHGRGAVAWRPADSRTGEPAVACSGPASSAGLVPSGASWWRCTSASPGTWRRLEPHRVRRRFIRLSHPAVTGLDNRTDVLRTADAATSHAGARSTVPRLCSSTPGVPPRLRYSSPRSDAWRIRFDDGSGNGDGDVEPMVDSATVTGNVFPGGQSADCDQSDLTVGTPKAVELKLGRRYEHHGGVVAPGVQYLWRLKTPAGEERLGSPGVG